MKSYCMGWFVSSDLLLMHNVQRMTFYPIHKWLDYAAVVIFGRMWLKNIVRRRGKEKIDVDKKEKETEINCKLF